MKKVLLLLVSALVATACTKDRIISRKNEPVIPKIFGSVYGVNGFAEAEETFGEYTIFGVVANGGVTIRAKAKAFNPNRSSVYLYASFMPDKTRRLSRIDVGDFIINREKWEFQDVAYMPSGLDPDAESEFAADLFGKDVSISLEQGGQTVVSSNFRAPVRLTQFDVANSSPVSPSVDVRWIPIAKGVNIDWNADRLNENGLVLTMISQGDTNNAPNTGSKKTRYKGIFIEDDDGEYTIPTSFFENLTKDELINLTLYRGKFDYIRDDGKGYDYKFYALSEISGYFKVQ